MVHWTRILVPAILFAAAFAGCLGADDADPANGEEPVNGDENGNGNGNNETAEPPPVVHDPVPTWSVSISVGGGAAIDPPFVIARSQDLNITLDGSGSTVEDSTIDVYAWSVLRPNGREEMQSSGNPLFTFEVPNMQTVDLGVYTVTLRTLTAAGGLASTTGTFAISTNQSYAFEGTLVGVGLLGGCAGVPAEGSPLAEDIWLGTYLTEQLSTAPNVTRLDITLEFGPGPLGSEVTVYVFREGSDVSDCSAAIADSGAGGSPLSFSVDMPAQTILERYTFRIDMDGVFLEGYTMDVVAHYGAPGDDAGDDNGDNGE